MRNIHKSLFKSKLFFYLFYNNTVAQNNKNKKVFNAIYIYIYNNICIHFDP